MRSRKPKRDWKRKKNKKKKQKAKAEKAKQPIQDLETVLEGLTLDDGIAGDDVTDDEAICQSLASCTLQMQKTSYGSAVKSVTSGMISNAPSWEVKGRLPDTYICDLYK